MKYKSLIYILFFILIAFSISTSFIVLHKKQYVPRSQVLKDYKKDLNNPLFINLKKGYGEFCHLITEYKLFSQKFEVEIEVNKNVVWLWLKSNKKNTLTEINSNYYTFLKANNEPLKNNKTEHFINFYNSLFINNSNNPISNLNSSINNIFISNNIFFKSISFEPQSPPPKSIM